MTADRVLNFVQVCWCTLGRGVSSISNRVDGYVLETFFCRPFEKSANVIYMAMYAAIGAETEQMECATSVA